MSISKDRLQLNPVLTKYVWSTPVNELRYIDPKKIDIILLSLSLSPPYYLLSLSSFFLLYFFITAISLNRQFFLL